jgi:hypothetical protein
MAHEQVRPALLRLLAQKAALPLVTQYKVGLTHIAQLQRHGNQSHFLSPGALHFEAPVTRLGSALEKIPDAPQGRSFHFFGEQRMGWELVR